MSEGIITRRGYDAGGKPELRTETFTGSTDWVVPNRIRGNIKVLVYGAGGGRTSNCGGGGGWMNNGEFNIPGGTNIHIEIGNGGSNQAGGTTSFGSYLSANGGEAGSRYLGGSGGSGGGGSFDRTISAMFKGGDGYQFGGGGGGENGGNGGQYGGGGGGCGTLDRAGKGGDGGMYGGGGGGGGYLYNGRSVYMSNGGNGGKYGGGGGGAISYTYSQGNYHSDSTSKSNKGIGGEYGGNGGDYSSIAEDGTNTIGWNNVPEEFQGVGKGGPQFIGELNLRNGSNINTFVRIIFNTGGGGGFGSNGGRVYGSFNIADRNARYVATFACGGGGGGGYGKGANGGNVRFCSMAYMEGAWYVLSGGGGGGYMSHGGRGMGSIITYSGGDGAGGGGGGGYYGNGGNTRYSGLYGSGGGGGGYYGNGGDGNGSIAGGGGGYGDGGSNGKTPGYGGGSGYYNQRGGDGICIIQYYI